MILCTTIHIDDDWWFWNKLSIFITCRRITINNWFTFSQHLIEKVENFNKQSNVVKSAHNQCCQTLCTLSILTFNSLGWDKQTIFIRIIHTRKIGSYAMMELFSVLILWVAKYLAEQNKQKWEKDKAAGICSLCLCLYLYLNL